MHGERADALTLTDRAQRDGEQGIGRFRLPVGDPRVVLTVLEIGIVKVDSGTPVCIGTKRDDAGTSSGDECRAQSAAEL